jgi:hypothetical protein
MATTKPRIQVTLKPSQYELLKRLAKVQRRPMSAILSELFDEIEPVYERMATVLEAAIRAQDTAKQGMRDALTAAEEEMRPHVAAAMGQFDLLEAQFGLSASVIGAASAAGGPISAAVTPGSVTRGSGTPTPPPQAGTIPPSPVRSSPRKSRTSLRFRDSERKSPGRSVRSVAAAIARQVKKGPKGRR